MAFHDYHAREGNNFPEAGSDQRPDLTPLNLELVPPVLCHSFGIPMHDGYFVPGANMYSYGYAVPGAMRPGDLHQAGFPGQFINDPQLAHGGAMNYGVLPGDPNGYSQQGYPQARMYPYHPAFAQGPRQMPYPAPNDMYNASLFRRAENGAMDMRMGANPAQISGYDCLVQQRPGGSDGINRGIKRTADQAASLNSEPCGSVPAQAHLEAVALKRTRLVWTPELHQRFEDAVLRAGGIEVAVPKTVLEVLAVQYMNVDGLTRDNVASHLQKHRMHLKKGKSEAKPSSRSQSKPYTQAEAPATVSAKTCDTTTQRERSQPSSPHCTAEGEATTMQIFTNDEAMAAKSNANFVSTTDEAGRAHGESSGDGTSGSGSGNSSSRNMTSVVLATPHSHTGSARDSRVMPSEAPTGSRLMVSFGNTGCSNVASNYTSKAAQARSSSQTQDVPRDGKSHNNSNGNSHPGHGQTRGSKVQDAGRVDDSNGTSATCGQSECDRPLGS